MKTCSTCGEPIALRSATCPFCETPQTPAPGETAPGPPLRTIDIEAGLPTVAEALGRLEAQLHRARADGVRLVRVIHGWGSATGGGGKIRAAARRWLLARQHRGQFQDIVFGDHFTPTAPEGRDFLRRHPALRPGERTDRTNPGITFVEL